MLESEVDLSAKSVGRVKQKQPMVSSQKGQGKVVPSSAKPIQVVVDLTVEVRPAQSFTSTPTLHH